MRRELKEFDYGYAPSRHKAPGFQRDNAMLFDERKAFRDNRAQWIYTAITRAAQRVYVVV